jgi:hypothetical protein
VPACEPTRWGLPHTSAGRSAGTTPARPARDKSVSRSPAAPARPTGVSSRGAQAPARASRSSDRVRAPAAASRGRGATAARDSPKVQARVRLPPSALQVAVQDQARLQNEPCGVRHLGGLFDRVTPIDLRAVDLLRVAFVEKPEFSPPCHGGDRGCKSRRRRPLPWANQQSRLPE